jgi:hypothetical protein
MEAREDMDETADKLDHIVGMMRERIGYINANADRQIATIREEIQDVLTADSTKKSDAQKMLEAADAIIKQELAKLKEITDSNFTAYEALAINEKITTEQFRSLLQQTTEQFAKTSEDLKYNLANNYYCKRISKVLIKL